MVGNVPEYTITNDKKDRAIDANATSIHELADVVSTLVKDLKEAGVVK